MSLILSLVATGCGRNPARVQAALPSSNKNIDDGKNLTGGKLKSNDAQAENFSYTGFDEGPEIDGIKKSVENKDSLELASNIISISTPELKQDGVITVQTQWKNHEPINFQGSVIKQSETNYQLKLKSASDPDYRYEGSCSDPDCKNMNAFLYHKKTKLGNVQREDVRELEFVWPYDKKNLAPNMTQDSKDFISRLAPKNNSAQDEKPKVLVKSNVIYPGPSSLVVEEVPQVSKDNQKAKELFSVQTALVETEGRQVPVAAINPILSQYGKTFLVGNSERGEVEFEFEGNPDVIKAGAFPDGFALRLVKPTPPAQKDTSAPKDKPVSKAQDEKKKASENNKILEKKSEPVSQAQQTKTKPDPSQVQKAAPSQAQSLTPEQVQAGPRPQRLLNQILTDCNRPELSRWRTFWTKSDAGNSSSGLFKRVYKSLGAFVSLLKESFSSQTKYKDAADYRWMRTYLLQNADLPEELGFITLIESGFNPYASAAPISTALGYWQLLKGTAVKGGILPEQRTQIGPSTQVASALLNENLRLMYENMPLAIATYKAGIVAIQNDLKTVAGLPTGKKTGLEEALKYHHSYWEIRNYHEIMKQEDRDYVPKLFAAICIYKNP
jgi:hypothetical protein